MSRPRKTGGAAASTGYSVRLWSVTDKWVSAAAGSIPRSLMVLAVFSCVLMLPSLCLGVNQTDSSGYDYVWAKQFAELTLSGELYPRWLPGSFGGLGSPTFIFYPPLAFFIDALVNVVTFDVLPIPYRLAATATVLLWLSGVAMYIWLIGVTRPKVTFLASLIYISAPYHMTDHYWRGAIAEFSFFAVFPLLALSIRVAAREWRGVAGVAMSFALLIMAHIPAALLASATALPIYAIYVAARQGMLKPAIHALLRCSIGVVLGLGLAAFYLVPALTLQGDILSERLWGSYYTPGRWLFLHVMQWPSPQFMAMIVSFATALAVLSIGVALLVRHASDPRRLETVVWAADQLTMHLAYGRRRPAILDGYPVRGQGAVPMAHDGACGIRCYHRPRDGDRSDAAACRSQADGCGTPGSTARLRGAGRA